MPTPIFSLDDITLDGVDGNKPAELDLSQPAVTPEQPAQEAVPQVEPPETPTPTENTPEPPEDPSKQAQTDLPEPTPPPKPEGDTEDEKLSPFHEHPDWKKMQQTLDSLKQQNEELMKIQREAATKQADPDKYAGMTRAQIAEQILEDKTKTGWKPKDQLEYDMAKQDALDTATEVVKKRQAAESEAKQTAEQEAIKRVQQELDDQFEAAKVTDPEERKKVEATMKSWLQQGISVTTKSVPIIVENLRLKGELTDPTRPTVPTQTAESKAKEQSETTARNQANRKIAKPGSGGTGTTKQGPSYKEIHHKDLDTIILEQAQALQ